MAVVNRFLADLPGGLAEARYRTDELPRLAFGEEAFGLAFCSR